MINEVIHLIKDDDNITLTTYCGDNTGYKRDALLVLPGGGYWQVCADREGEPVALSFLAKGVNCFVLNYSVRERATFPNPIYEASLAIKYIKDNADKYGIDKDRVFAVGFSAGGHLAACLGSLWHLDEVNKKIPDMEFGYNKPKGTILCYPLILSKTMIDANCLENMFDTQNPTNEMLNKYSIEKHIDERSAPAFFMHTANDELVPVENTLYAALAFSKAKVPFEIRIYLDAPHGIALGNKITCGSISKHNNPEVARWVDDAFYWMEHLK